MPLDETHGLNNMNRPSQAFLWEVQKRGVEYDVVLVMSGLDICNRAGSYDQPLSCSPVAVAQNLVSRWPFFREHSCTHKTALIEVANPNETVSMWLTAVATAHEIVHLIGTTQHDGEDDYYGRGPGGHNCRGENGHIMSHGSLYRLCKDYEPWSECTIEQVKFYTADWTIFCPGTTKGLSILNS